MSLVSIKFDDTFVLQLEPNPAHDWLLTTEQVAEGYGVSIATIRGHKMSHADELVQDKHFIGVRNSNTVGSGGSLMTLWTKRGVVRLGFFIRSERAKKFRNFCEDLVISTLEQPAAPDPFGDIGFDWKAHGPIRTHMLLSLRERYAAPRPMPKAEILDRIADVESLVSVLEKLLSFLYAQPTGNFPDLWADLETLNLDWIYAAGQHKSVADELKQKLGVTNTKALPVALYRLERSWLLDKVVSALKSPQVPV